MLCTPRGFTLIETLVVSAVIGILVTISVSSFVVLQKKSTVDYAAQEFAGLVKLAQNQTVASEGASQYGVYLDTGSTPHRYILFKGGAYATRDSTFDQIRLFAKTLEFGGINLGGGNEIVFDKLTGYTSQSGNLSLRLKDDASQTKIVYISSSGIIRFDPPVFILDDRLKDSRHVHLDYAKTINTSTENVVLTFDGSTVQTIPMATNLVSGQFFWEGTVSAGGQDQVIKIHTHALNSSGNSQFSVHRDRRFNTKSLAVTLSGDSTGAIAQYSADGLTTNFSSIYVSNFAWQ